MGSAGTMMITLARQTFEWLRARPRLVDVFFTGLIALLAFADFYGEGVTDRAREPDALGVFLVAIAAIPLVWRRTAPAAVMVWVVGVSTAFYARDYGSFMAAVPLAAMYAVIAYESSRAKAWITVAIAFGILFAVASVTLLDGVNGFRWSNALSMTLSVGATVLAAAAIRNKEEIFADTKARAERAEADRRAESERAVVRERLRIAREMHDVVAHGMSLITVQAAAAREVAHTRPDDAARLMDSVESTGRDALIEMRRMLGVLRNGDPADSTAAHGSLAPQPSLADLASIIAHCNDAGTPTELIITGSQRPLPAGVELAAFRIVQEALTNVVKHAGHAATATVELRYSTESLQLTISDTGRGAVSELTRTGGGHGVIGMRERIEIYDGQLTAGPRPGGGYRVDVSLPIDTKSDRPVVISAESETTAPA